MPAEHRHLFSVGDAVEARDFGEEEWRFGIVVSFDEEGQPRIKVEGFTDAFVWDEHRAAA